MSKAVLILDMPKDCDGCRQLRTQTHCNFCNMTHKNIYDTRFKPEWCPLRELPKKIGTEEALKMPRNGCISDVINSYNACIDELLKGEEG